MDWGGKCRETRTFQEVIRNNRDNRVNSINSCSGLTGVVVFRDGRNWTATTWSASRDKPHSLCHSNLEQPIRDWQNVCITAAQNDLIYLSGDFKWTNGARESRGCSSWSSLVFTELRSAESVISWMTWKKRQNVLKREIKASKQAELGALQIRAGRRLGHRHEQRNENERRGDVHLWTKDGDGFFNVIDFQRPDRISGSFPPAFKLVGLVEIAHSRIGGKPFFEHSNRCWIRRWRLGKNGLFFNGLSGFFAYEASDFFV